MNIAKIHPKARPQALILQGLKERKQLELKAERNRTAGRYVSALEQTLENDIYALQFALESIEMLLPV